MSDLTCCTCNARMNSVRKWQTGRDYGRNYGRIYDRNYDRDWVCHKCYQAQAKYNSLATPNRRGGEKSISRFGTEGHAVGRQYPPSATLRELLSLTEY